MKDIIQPEIRVYAGPNGSGKSTITRADYILGTYINADEIKKNFRMSDLAAAQLATKIREEKLAAKESFTFETVMSTERNVLLLERAKQRGYFIRCIFLVTTDPEINVGRVVARTADGGHDVPHDKIRTRYYRSLALLPRLSIVCDRLNIYDNSLTEPQRILKKRDATITIYPNSVWSEYDTLELITHAEETPHASE